MNLIKTAALGRPFKLGMLYDCRKDELIAGTKAAFTEIYKENNNTSIYLIQVNNLIKKIKTNNPIKDTLKWRRNMSKL